jgi:hypothetical protein
VEVYQWESLIEKLGGVRLQMGLDESYWCLEKKRHYTTKSMYRFLVHRGAINTHMRRLWKTKLPMKLKVFMWQVFHDKLQTGEELKNGTGKGMENVLFALCQRAWIIFSSHAPLLNLFGFVSKKPWAGTGSL